MRHEQYRQWLPLSIYGELNENEERALEEHLAECRECRAEESELRQMLQTVKSQLPEPPPGLLNEARAQLRGALKAEPRPGLSASVYRRSRVAWPVALAASLVAGLVIGRVLLPYNQVAPNTGPRLGPGTVLANISLLDTDTADGQLEVEFDAVERVRLKAPPSDPRIQFVLLEALRGAANAGIRIRAVAAVEEQFLPQYNEALKQALIQALERDSNVGVRRRALTVLQKMPRDAAIRQALIEVLIHDQNPGLRVAAINALEEDALEQVPLDSRTVRRLRERLGTEDNDFIRLRSEAWLEEVRFQ